jgi:hypothetical protein
MVCFFCFNLIFILLIFFILLKLFFYNLTLQSKKLLPSYLFFILIFTLILLVIIFYFRSLCVIGFFFPFLSSIFDLLGIGLHYFYRVIGLKANTVQHLLLFLSYFLFLFQSSKLLFYIKKKWAFYTHSFMIKITGFKSQH